MISLYMCNLKIPNTENRLVTDRGQGVGMGRHKMGEEGQKPQSSSHEINKSCEYNVTVNCNSIQLTVMFHYVFESC